MQKLHRIGMENMILMFKRMTIRAENEKVAKLIISRVPVRMMNSQYFEMFFIPTFGTFFYHSSPLKGASDTPSLRNMQFSINVFGFCATDVRTILYRVCLTFPLCKFFPAIIASTGSKLLLIFRSPAFLRTKFSLHATAVGIGKFLPASEASIGNSGSLSNLAFSDSFAITSTGTITGVSLNTMSWYIKSLSTYWANKIATLLVQFKTFSVFKIASVVTKSLTSPFNFKRLTAFSTLCFHRISLKSFYWGSLTRLVCKVNSNLKEYNLAQ